METPQQAAFFMKLSAGAEKLAALTEEAKKLNLPILVRDLPAHAAAIEDSVLLQQRALSDKSLASGEELPFILK